MLTRVGGGMEDNVGKLNTNEIWTQVSPRPLTRPYWFTEAMEERSRRKVLTQIKDRQRTKENKKIARKKTWKGKLKSIITWCLVCFFICSQFKKKKCMHWIQNGTYKNTPHVLMCSWKARMNHIRLDLRASILRSQGFNGIYMFCTIMLFVLWSLEMLFF